jgi:hypothetical protein
VTERATCESCGRIARVQLVDGSLWCLACNAAAILLGYDGDQGTLVGSDS